MVGRDHRPPESLTILHEFLEICRHSLLEWLRLEVHDGDIPGDKRHGRQALIRRGFPSGVKTYSWGNMTR